MTRSAIEYLQSGDIEHSERIFRHILELDPTNVAALHFTGVIYYRKKDYPSSIAYIRKALFYGPAYVDAYNNLGIVLQETGRLDEAISSYEKAIQLNPNFERAHYNLGTALRDKWLLDDAIFNYQQVIKINPHFVEAYNNLGLALQEQGRLDEAEDSYRQALLLKPTFALCHSNLLLLMNYNSRHSIQDVFAEHLRFWKQFGEPLASSIPRHMNDPESSRRIKIGYVSPDFRRHSVNYFIEPVLASHDHEQFEIFCYSDVQKPDEVTERLQGYADQWRAITGVSDKEVSDMIRKDRIDILVDLAGHTGYNRMLTFVRKPAPVQVSWLGYPNTTGLRSIDYRIVDSYTDPPGLTDSYYTEKLMRVPGSFLCYRPPEDSPSFEKPPSARSNYVTFGSFNYFPKISPKNLKIWADILKAVQYSRLIMKTRNFADESTCRYVKDIFSQFGIEKDRIQLLAIRLSFTEHLDMYNRVDVALDSFPYHGTTTTCEALWMGVPVVTLAGESHASRVGVSLLSNIGLAELIAKTPETYVEVAVSLAADIKRRQTLRQNLRNIMRHSPLMNEKQFTARLELQYREMWSAWSKAR